jgi:hypothetical protein
VTAVSKGTATITAKISDEVKDVCTVTVKEAVNPEKVTLNKSSYTLKGSSASVTLTATVSPSNATNKTVTWSSSNTSVAKVSSSGKVTPVANGTATITATTANSKAATCTITVSGMGSGSYTLSGTSLTLKDFPKATSTSVTLSEVKIGSVFYTYYKNSAGKYVASTGGSSYLVKVGTVYKNVGASQCMAFARYVQQKLYGCNEYSNGAKFTKLSDASVAAGKLTTSKLKDIIQRAGVGAHIRTNGKKHSMIVINITDKGFTIVDANGTSTPYVSSVRTYTWSSYLSGYGQRGIDYVMVYTG